MPSLVVLLGLLGAASAQTCASWCNAYTCALGACSGCSDCTDLTAGNYCAGWCNPYTCGFQHCEGCSVCSTLASDGYCASWCNKWTPGFQHCAACPTSWTSLNGAWLQYNTNEDTLPAECFPANSGAAPFAGLYTQVPDSCCTNAPQNANPAKPLYIFPTTLFHWNTSNYPADTVCRDMSAIFAPGAWMLGACDGQGRSWYGEGCNGEGGIANKCGCQGIAGPAPSQPACWRAGDFPDSSFGPVRWFVWHEQCGA